MNSVFLYILIVLVVFGLALLTSYKKDPGQHRRAKAVHAVLMVVFAWIFVGSFRELFTRVGNIDQTIDAFREHGIILHTIDSSLGLAYSLVAVITAWQAGRMVNRRPKSRLRFLRLLPFLYPITLVYALLSQYQFSLITSGASIFIYIMMAVPITLFFFLYWKVYQMPFMIRFCEFQNPLAELDSSIDEIGREDQHESV